MLRHKVAVNEIWCGQCINIQRGPRKVIQYPYLEQVLLDLRLPRRRSTRTHGNQGYRVITDADLDIRSLHVFS